METGVSDGVVFAWTELLLLLFLTFAIPVVALGWAEVNAMELREKGWVPFRNPFLPDVEPTH